MTEDTTVVLKIIHGISEADPAAGMTITLTNITFADRPEVVFATGSNSAPASPADYRFILDKRAMTFGNRYQVSVGITSRGGIKYQDSRTFSLVPEANEITLGLKLSPI
ncbi:hypothetical protein N5F23_26720 [Pseudomonas sichuanensis]|uniref:hypothetical protein n=1 Tax=Pseudomonas sichuanensis TaxID=2213015 RepID=UPI00244CB5B1|nr:hypothetical protein [Pseudomonas sichuanensis]MDH0734157.1 hypothetical protein [Pseudomonas sichuanensis]MDH1586196.1 hypothetical protein [Pseudomonas sichuanensis]MDH1595873.1 hypothetical protein [Pseudomonas sichuanensis]MDH1601088.1 hypothetical protein [Pseudomonas sichuanensis]